MSTGGDLKITGKAAPIEEGIKAVPSKSHLNNTISLDQRVELY